MKYDLVKKDFVMLLINLKICKIDECEKVDEEINNAIDKNMREDFDDVIDRETISIHDIDFENVANKKTNEVVDETDV